MINSERFIYHHQVLYVHPVLFLLSTFKGYSIDTILRDFISADIHCQSKLLSYWIDTVFYCYYCLCCCHLLSVISLLLLLLFTYYYYYLLTYYLLIYLLIFIISSTYLFCGLDLYKVQPFKSSPHIRFATVYIAYL